MSNKVSDEVGISSPPGTGEEKLCEKRSRCLVVKSLKLERDNIEHCSEQESDIEFIELLDDELSLSADSDFEKDTAVTVGLALKTNDSDVEGNTEGILGVDTNTSGELISMENIGASCIKNERVVIGTEEPFLFSEELENAQSQEENNDGDRSLGRNIDIPPLTITIEPVITASCSYEESPISYFCGIAEGLETCTNVERIVQDVVTKPLASMNRKASPREEITNETPAQTSLVEIGSANELIERSASDISLINSLSNVDLTKQTDNYSTKPVQTTKCYDDSSVGNGANSDQTEMQPCFVKIEQLSIVNLRKQYPNLVIRGGSDKARKKRVVRTPIKFRQPFPTSHKTRVKQTLARLKKANMQKVMLLSQSKTSGKSESLTDGITNSTSQNGETISCSRGCGSTFDNLSLLASHLAQCACRKLPQVSIPRVSSSAYSSKLPAAEGESAWQFHCAVCGCLYAKKVSNYGLCRACLAFTYQWGDYRRFRCNHQGNCSLLGKQRTSCQYCRSQAIMKTGLPVVVRAKIGFSAKPRRLISSLATANKKQSLKISPISECKVELATTPILEKIVNHILPGSMLQGKNNEEELKPTVKPAKQLTTNSITLAEAEEMQAIEAHAKQSEIVTETCQIELVSEESQASSVVPQPEADFVSNDITCAACGDSTKTFRYRGRIRMCRACDVFYSRSYRKHETFECNSDGNCAVNRDNRKQCKYCRFQNIVKAGATYKGFIRSERAKKAANRNSVQSSNGESQDKQQMNMKGSSQAKVNLKVMPSELLSELEVFGFVQLGSTNSIQFGICDQHGLITSNQTRKSVHQFDALMSFVPDDCVTVFGFDTNHDFLCNAVGAFSSEQISDAENTNMDGMNCNSLKNGTLNDQIVPEKNLMVYSPDTIYYPKPTPLPSLSDFDPLILTTGSIVYSPVSSEAVTVSTTTSVDPKVSTVTAASLPSSHLQNKERKLEGVISASTPCNVANEEQLSSSSSFSSSSESDVEIAELDADSLPSSQYESPDEEVEDDKILPLPVVTATAETIPLEEVRFYDENLHSPTQTYHQRLSLGSSRSSSTFEQEADQHVRVLAISDLETIIGDSALDKSAADIQVEEKMVSLAVTCTPNSDMGSVRTVQQLDGANDGSSDDASSKLSSSHSRSESENLTALESLPEDMSVQASFYQAALSGTQSQVMDNASAAEDVTVVQMKETEDHKSYDADTDDEIFDWTNKSTDYSSETSPPKPHALLVPQLALAMVTSAEFSLDDDILSQVRKENNGEVIRSVAVKSSHHKKPTMRSTRKEVEREDVMHNSENPKSPKQKKKHHRDKEKGENVSLDKPKTNTPKKGTENANSVPELNCQQEEAAAKQSSRNTGGDNLVNKKKKSKKSEKKKGKTKTAGDKVNKRQKQTDVMDIGHVSENNVGHKKHTENQIRTQTLAEVNKSSVKSGEKINLNPENPDVIKELRTGAKDVKCGDGNLSSDNVMLTLFSPPRKAKLKAIQDKAWICKFDQNNAEDSDDMESVSKVVKSTKTVLKDMGDNDSQDKNIVDATPKPKPKKKAENKQEKWNDLQEATALPDLSINVVLPSSSGDDSAASDEADSAGEDLVTTRKRTLRRKKPQMSNMEKRKQREEMIITRRAVLARMATPRSAVLCELVQEEAQKQCAELLLPKNLPMYEPVTQPSRVMPFPEVHLTEDDVSSLINSIFPDSCSVSQQDTQSLITDMKELKNQSVMPDNLLLMQLCLFISTSTSDPECLHNLLQVVAKYSMESGSKCCPLPSCAGSGKVFETSSQAGNHLLSHLPSVYTQFMGKAFRCTVCMEGFPTSLHHWDHWMSCHSEEPYSDALLQGFPSSCMEQLWLSPDYVTMMAGWNAAIVAGLRVPARDCSAHLSTHVSLETYKLPTDSFTCCGESFIECADEQVHALYDGCFFEDNLGDEHVAGTLECHELECIPIPCLQISDENDESDDLFSAPELLALVTNEPLNEDVSDPDIRSSVKVDPVTPDVAADEEVEDMTLLDQLASHSCQQLLNCLQPNSAEYCTKDEQAFMCWYCGLPVLGRVAFYRHLLQESLGAGGVHSGCCFMDAEDRSNLDSRLASTNIDITQPDTASTAESLIEHAYALPMLKCLHASCHFHASDWSDLGDHVINHLPEEMKELIPCWCGVCDESFASYYHAKHHWATNVKCMVADSKQIQIGQFLAHVTPGFHWTSNVTCDHITFTKHKKFRFCSEYRSASHVICWVCFKLFKHETDELGSKDLNQSQELLQKILETHLSEEHGITLSTGTKVYQAAETDVLVEEEDELTSSFLSKQNAMNCNLKVVCDKLLPTSEALAACHMGKKTTPNQAKQVRVRFKKCDIHQYTFNKAYLTCANCKLLSESYRYKLTNQESRERQKLANEKRRGFHCDRHNCYKSSCNDCRKMYWSNHKQPCIKHSSEGFTLSCYQCHYTTKLVALRKNRKTVSCECHSTYVNACLQCRLSYRKQLATERKSITEEMTSLPSGHSADNSTFLEPRNQMLWKHEDKSASSSKCASTARKARLTSPLAACAEHTAVGFMKSCVKCLVSHVRVISLQCTGAVSTTCLQDTESNSVRPVAKSASSRIKKQDTESNSLAARSISQKLREKRPCCTNHHIYLPTCPVCYRLYEAKIRQRPSCEKHSYHIKCCTGCKSVYQKMMLHKLAVKSTDLASTSTTRDTNPTSAPTAGDADKVKSNREAHLSESITRTAGLSTASQDSAHTLPTATKANKSRKKHKCCSLNKNGKEMKTSKQKRQDEILVSSANTLPSVEKLNITSTSLRSRAANCADAPMKSKSKKPTSGNKSKEISLVFKRMVYGTVKRVSNAKVAMYDCSMTVDDFRKSIVVFSGEAINVNSSIESRIRAIGESGVGVIVACGPLDQLIVHYCNKYQLMIVAVKSRRDRTRMERITGATLVKDLLVPDPSALGYVEEVIVEIQEGAEVIVFEPGNRKAGQLMTSQQTADLCLPASAGPALPAPPQRGENESNSVTNVSLVGQSAVDESIRNSKELFSLMHAFNLPNDGELKDALNTVFSEESDKDLMSASAFSVEDTDPLSAGQKNQVSDIPLTAALSQQVSTPALAPDVASSSVAREELVHTDTGSNVGKHKKFSGIQLQSQGIVSEFGVTAVSDALTGSQPAKNRLATKDILRKTIISKRSSSQLSVTPPAKKAKITSKEPMEPIDENLREEAYWKDYHRAYLLHVKENRVSCQKHSSFTYGCCDCRIAHKKALSCPDYRICTSRRAANAARKFELVETSTLAASGNISAKRRVRKPSDAFTGRTKQKTSRKQKPAGNSDPSIRKRGRPAKVDPSSLVKTAKTSELPLSVKITTRRPSLPRFVNMSGKDKQNKTESMKIANKQNKTRSMKIANKDDLQKESCTLASAVGEIEQPDCHRRQASTQADKKRREQSKVHSSTDTKCKLAGKPPLNNSRNENRGEIKQKMKSSATEKVCRKRLNESPEDVTQTKKRKKCAKVQSVATESSAKVKPSPRKTRSVTSLNAKKPEHRMHCLDNNALHSDQQEIRSDKFTSPTLNKNKHSKQRQQTSDEKKSKPKKHSGKINMADGTKSRSKKSSGDISMEISAKVKKPTPKHSGSSSGRIKENDEKSKCDVVKATQVSTNLGLADADDAKIKKVDDLESNSVKPDDVVVPAESTMIESVIEGSIHQVTDLVAEMECSNAKSVNCNSGKVEPMQVSTGSVTEAAIINNPIELDSGTVTKQLDSKVISGGNEAVVAGTSVCGNGEVVSDGSNAKVAAGTSAGGDGEVAAGTSDGGDGEVVSSMSNGGDGEVVSAMSDGGNGEVVSAMPCDGGNAEVVADSYKSLFQHKYKKMYRHIPSSSSVFQSTTSNSVIKAEPVCDISPVMSTSTRDSAFYDHLSHGHQIMAQNHGDMLDAVMRRGHKHVYLLDNYGEAQLLQELVLTCSRCRSTLKGWDIYLHIGQHDEEHCFACPKRFKTRKHVWKHLRKTHLNLQVESSTTDPPLPAYDLLNEKQTEHMKPATELADPTSDKAKHTEKLSSSRRKKSAAASTSHTDTLTSSVQKHSASPMKKSASSSTDLTDVLPKHRNRRSLSRRKKAATELADPASDKAKHTEKLSSSRRKKSAAASTSHTDTLTSSVQKHSASPMKKGASCSTDLTDELPEHRNRRSLSRRKKSASMLEGHVDKRSQKLSSHKNKSGSTKLSNLTKNTVETTAVPSKRAGKSFEQVESKEDVIMTTCDGTLVHLRPTRSGKYKLK